MKNDRWPVNSTMLDRIGWAAELNPVERAWAYSRWFDDCDVAKRQKDDLGIVGRFLMWVLGAGKTSR
jgi:hypothetical protein